MADGAPSFPCNRSDEAMRLVIFFWLLSAILFLGGAADGEIGWLLAAGAVAIIALLLSVLYVTHRMVERARHR